MPELLGVYESDKAIVRIYTGKQTDTEEKRRELFGQAMKSFARDIWKSNPELFNQIVGRNAE